LKQLGLGFAQYKQDFDEIYPNVGINPVSWDKMIEPYIGTKVRGDSQKNPLVFRCPSDATGTGSFAGKERTYSVPRVAINWPGVNVSFAMYSGNEPKIITSSAVPKPYRDYPVGGTAQCRQLVRVNLWTKRRQS
jgi:hypothetical protein